MTKKKHIIHVFEYTNDNGEGFYCDGPDFADTFNRFIEGVRVLFNIEKPVKKKKKGE